MRLHRLLVTILAIVPLVSMTGCRDEIAAPTLGFVEVDTGGVEGVQVLVNGEMHTGPGVLGPFEAGQYEVSVSREFYEVTPSSVEVTVVPAETARAAFLMELVAPGNIRVTAHDELLGGVIEGAEIHVSVEGGPFEATGVLTPGTVEDVPPGGARVQVRRAGYEDSPPVGVQVVPLETVDAEAQLGPQRAVLAEMFTYVTCPNCPPAADELETIHSDFHGQVHVIEWHSVPPLPLYDPRWQVRQNAYTGGTPIGWPAVIVQGGYLEAEEEKFIIGSQESDLQKYRQRITNYLEQCANDCPVAMTLTGSIDAVSAEVIAHVKRRPGPVPGGLMLRFVLIENEVIAPGNDPPYNFVPRELVEQVAVLPAEGEVLQFPASLPVSSGWSVDHLEVVAYIQSDATREIVAISGLK